MDCATKKEDNRPKFGILCPVNTSTFPGKLWKLVNDENYQSVTWNHSGSAIDIHSRLFKAEVLHSDDFSMFKTQNFSSFVRQLNLYGFRKTTISSRPTQGHDDKKAQIQMHQFQHPCFMRSRPDMLNHVKRASSRKRAREYTFGSEPDISPTMVPMRSGASPYFPTWGSSPKSNISTPKFGRSGFSRPERVNLKVQQSQSFNYDYEDLSPVRDIIRHTLFPPVMLREDQHPFRRADRNLPCALSMTWMGNIAEGSLTSSDLGITSPETLMVEHGKLRRFVVVPDDTVSYLSRIQVPSSDFLESFRPETLSGSEVPGPTIQTPMVSPAPAPVHCETVVSWSNTTPLVTHAQQVSVSRGPEPRLVAAATPESAQGILHAAFTLMYAKDMSAMMDEGEDGDEQVIVIKVEQETP